MHAGGEDLEDLDGFEEAVGGAVGDASRGATRGHSGAMPGDAPGSGTRTRNSGSSSSSEARRAAAKQLEELRRDQNEHLLRVLQEEQGAEDAREAALAKEKDPKRRRSLEEKFAVERGEASTRLLQITQDHEVVLADRMRELGLAPTMS